MSDREQPRTRAREQVEPNDAHPLIDLNELANQTRALEREELGAEIAANAVDRIGEQVRPILDQEMSRVYPEYAAATTPAQRAEVFNRIRLSGDSQFRPTMQAVAARVTDEIGLSDASLAATFNTFVGNTTERMQGVGNDIQGFNGEQWLTVALMGGGTYLLSGHRGLSAGVAGLGVMINSHNLTQAATSVVGGGLRAAGYGAIWAPLQVSARTVLGAGEALAGDWNGVRAQGEGVLNDFGHDLSQILGQDVSPTANPMLQDFLEQHRGSAPTELQPLLNYMYALRAGDFENLEMVTETQLVAAGQFLRQTEPLVNEETFWRLEGQALQGELNDENDKQLYLLNKFHMMVMGTFMANQETAEYDLIMRGYNQAEIAPLLALDQAIDPATVANLDLNLSDEQIRQIESHPLTAERFGQLIFSRDGAGSRTLAVAYLYFMMMGPIIKGVRGVLFRETDANAVAEVPERQRPLDERSISERRRRGIVTAMGRNRATIGSLAAALTTAGVLTSGTEYSRAFRGVELSTLDEENLNRLRSEAELEGATPGSLRPLFFSLIERAPGVDTEAIAERTEYYRFRDQMSQLQMFYHHGARNTPREFRIGQETLTVTTPQERGRWQFGANFDSMMRGFNPRNWYRSLTDNPEGLAVRLDDGRYLHVRRNSSGQYQYNVRTARLGAWQNFDLNDQFGFESGESND